MKQRCTFCSSVRYRRLVVFLFKTYLNHIVKFSVFFFLYNLINDDAYTFFCANFPENCENLKNPLLFTSVFLYIYKVCGINVNVTTLSALKLLRCGKSFLYYYYFFIMLKSTLIFSIARVWWQTNCIFGIIWYACTAWAWTPLKLRQQ